MFTLLPIIAFYDFSNEKLYDLLFGVCFEILLRNRHGVGFDGYFWALTGT